MEALLKSYLLDNNFSFGKTRTALRSSKTINVNQIKNDLQRGWYNELAYAFPLKDSLLGLSFRDIQVNRLSAANRFTFPSLKIIASYYSAYFYLRSATLFKNSSFRLEEHNATINSFNHNALKPLSGTLLNFPLNIAYVPGDRVYRNALPTSNIPHLRFIYSQHPRQPHLSPSGLFEKVFKDFKQRSKKWRRPKNLQYF